MNISIFNFIQIVNALIEIKERLVSILYPLLPLLLIPLFHAPNFLLPPMQQLDIRYVSIGVLLNLNLVHGLENLRWVDDAGVSLALL